MTVLGATRERLRARPEELMLEFVEIILFSNSFVFLNLCSTFLKIMLRYAYHIELKRQTCTVAWFVLFLFSVFWPVPWFVQVSQNCLQGQTVVIRSTIKVRKN